VSKSATVKFRIDGLAEVRAVLNTLPAEMQDKVLRPALARAARPLVNAAKNFARSSERTGALVRSLGAVVKRGKLGSGTAYAVVGARASYYSGGKRLKRGERAAGADRPANYAHLVEFGHAVVAPKAGTSLRKRTATQAKNGRTHVPAKPFLRPAVLTAKSAIGRELAAGISAELQRQLRRLVKNPGAPR